MQHLTLSSYQKVNGSFHRQLIYHAGIDCGFCVELNYMVNAMLYCLAEGYRFQLYSEDANFGTGKGWTEYFELIVSIDLLLHAKKLAGSITTGPSVFIMKQRYAEPSVIAVDCAKEMLESALTLPIDSRAAISADSMI